jgi:hypothetical protein
MEGVVQLLPPQVLGFPTVGKYATNGIAELDYAATSHCGKMNALYSHDWDCSQRRSGKSPMVGRIDASD